MRLIESKAKIYDKFLKEKKGSINKTKNSQR